MKRFYSTFAMSLVAGIFLASCSAAEQPENFLGSWVVSETPDGTPDVFDETQIVITEDRLTATLGCNVLAAEYEVNADGELQIVQGGAPEVGCTEPGQAEAESVLFSALNGLIAFESVDRA